MGSQSFLLVVLALPLILAAIVGLLNSGGVNSATEKAEAWVRAAESGVHEKPGKFSRYIARPFLLGVVKFSDWTGTFEHRGLKNGARVAGTLYLGLAWAYVLFVLVQIMVLIVVVGVIIVVAFKVLVNSDDDVRRGYDAARRVVGTAPAGHRVHPETGVIQEEGLLGWRDTDRRINPETGVLQESGLIGWRDTDTRIDQDSGNIQEEELLGFRDTDTRINPVSGVIEKEGLVGWEETDERIDPKTGKRQTRGLLGWVDD